MTVTEYLKNHTLEELIERTKCKAVRHPDYDNLVMLKYNQIESPMGDELVQQCRGLILDESDGYRVISWPYNKFFNHGEGHAASIDWKTAKIYEKLDGSIVTLYHYDGMWHVASNGHPSAGGNLPYSDMTFKELFWEVWEELEYGLPDGYEDCCFMFELMTPHNRVVIRHDENKLAFHGLRNVRTGKEERPSYIGNEFGWDIVKTFDFDNLNAIIKMALELDGSQQEGFVVCDDDFNRVKVKAQSYVALHHLRSVVDVPAAKNRRLLEIILANEKSEFLDYFPEYTEDYEQINNAFKSLCGHIENRYNEVKDIEIQKDFALKIKNEDCSSCYFMLRANKISNVREYFVNQGAKKSILFVERWMI